MKRSLAEATYDSSHEEGSSELAVHRRTFLPLIEKTSVCPSARTGQSCTDAIVFSTVLRDLSPGAKPWVD